jgi:hypothetical protein
VTELTQSLPTRRGPIALIIAFLLAVGLAQTGLGHSVLGAAGLFKKPASYTSLSFQNPDSLPDQLSKGQVTIPVSFVIDNTGGNSRDYQWSMTVIQGRQTRLAVAGTVILGPGHTTAISRPATISCTADDEDVRIEVRLTRPAEYIDARTACLAPKR